VLRLLDAGLTQLHENVVFGPDWSMVVPVFESHALVLALGVTSGVLCIASLFGALWALKRLPEDYLLHDDSLASRSPVAKFGWVLRNLVGVVLLVAGIAMLVLPGQGLLTLLAAVSLMDFPGKRRLERRLLSRPRVLEVLNRWRRRVGRPPLRSA
jgi:Putative transmembrane protein (PGPGW)